MKELLKNLDKAFENKVRLGIMAALVANEYMDFNGLKSLMGLTDGNLASHLKALEKREYIAFRKKFVNRKPNTRYEATVAGREAFRKHIEAIERLLRS